jgi:uncharacterized protein YheU (UPF0270 family)
LSSKNNTAHGEGVGAGVIVPWQELSPEALQGLIEEFVTRDGTDTGYARKSLAADVSRVKRQLAQGRAVIVYDEALKTCNIVSCRDIDGRSGD